jgi:benzoyl-CoA reductase subunit B
MDAGKNLQRAMMAREYDALSKAKETKTPVAYLFISGNIQELFRSFGFLVAYPEINALQCGIKRRRGRSSSRPRTAGTPPTSAGT